MTTTTQQIPSNPALDFANAILEETNGGLELIEILHDIAQGNDEDATTNDRITAANILADRGLGKCPKQPPAPNPNPKTDDVGAIRESPPAVPHDQPESPRLVTQIKDALQDSLGPAPTPSTHSPLSTSHYPLATIHYNLLSSSTSSKSPTTARPSATPWKKSPGPKTTRRSNPATASGPPESYSTDSSVRPSEVEPASPLSQTPPKRNPSSRSMLRSWTRLGPRYWPTPRDWRMRAYSTPIARYANSTSPT